jgi:hypothetical protein
MSKSITEIEILPWLYEKKWGKSKKREDREYDHPPSASLPFRFLTLFPQHALEGPSISPS